MIPGVGSVLAIILTCRAGSVRAQLNRIDKGKEGREGEEKGSNLERMEKPGERRE